MEIIINGLKVNYYQSGSGPDLVILHGWGRDTSEWFGVLKALETKYRVWLIDLPGFGGSQAPPDTWGIEDYGKLVKDFISQNKIQNAILIGHSFGGRIAIILGRHNHHLFTKLILLNSAGIKLRLSFKGKIINTCSKFLKIMPLPCAIRDKVNAISPALLKRLGVESADYLALKKVFERIVAQDLTNELKEISLSTLILWGENDRVVPVKYAKMMHNFIPGSALKIIPGAGHLPHLEKPAEFLIAISQFLRNEPA